MTVGPLTALASSRCSSRRSPGGPCIEMRTRHPAAREREHQGAAARGDSRTAAAHTVGCAARPVARDSRLPHVAVAVRRLRERLRGCRYSVGYAGLAARRGRARCGLLLGCAQPGLVLLWPENRL